MRVLVIGAGVTGLSVGIRLAESGYDTHVLARELPLETTSAVAAAIWYPYLAKPFDRVLAWSEVALREFRRLAEEENPDETGIVMREGIELLEARSEDPWWWVSAVPDWRRLDFAPPPYRDGWTFTTPVIEMPIYLSWLRRRFEAAGGTVTRMALSALPDHADLVVNCSGLGARLLGADDEVEPVRGQVVRLRQIGLERWLLAEKGPTYVVPRSADIVVGGTEEHGAWDRSPSPAVAADIMRRATALVPELADAEVIGHRVGLRPARPTVRLEPEKLTSGHRVIHCYGHGGAGVTISWGCADEVLDLVQSETPP